MNLLDAEDMIKSLPDQALMQQAQMPTGDIPQFLVISEIKNRADMRKRYEAQLKEQPQGTVAEQVMREGIAGMMPQQGVTPQMGQQPPQGGPQMPQQGMPPQGGPQGMPPQGMPPQGMPPQMPPQGGPQGMPPQMPPQGMPPQGMPPGMPPMGMAAGGIVRMDGGGLTGMPGENALAGMQAELEAKAKVLAATTGRSFNEILEILVREAQMNMPDYSMVGRTGTGELPSMPPGTRPPKAVSSGIDLGALRDIDSAVGSGMQDMYGMIPKSSPDGGVVGRGLDRAGELGSGLAERASGLGQGISQGISEADRLLTEDLARSVAPMKDFDVAATQRVSDVYNKAGMGAGIGQFAREIPGAFGALGSSVMRDIQGLSDFPAVYEPARALQQTFTGSVPEDPTASFLDVTLGDIFGGKDKEPSQAADLFGTGFGAPTKPGTEPAAPIDTLLKEAQQANTDSSGKGLEKTGPPLQGTNNRAVQGTGSSATLSLIDEMMADLRGRETQASPTLDLSDILARSDRMTKANILMQLGSGIAGGDVAKGIEKAGMAGVQGAQEAAKIEMAQRISQTKAGQEDIRRGEQRDLDIAKLGIQREQVATMDQRLKNELSKAERVSKGQLFNLVSDLVQEATGDMVTDDKLGTVDKLSAYFMQKYAPLLGIDLSEEDLALLGGTYGGAGSPDPLGIRGAP